MGSVKLLPAFDAYLEAIDATVAAEGIDRDRITVYGFSMGGSTTWALIHHRPGFFAAAAPGAGAPPTDPAQYKALTSTAIWMFMGNQDPWAGSWRSTPCIRTRPQPWSPSCGACPPRPGRRRC
jgi:predicted peptidase